MKNKGDNQKVKNSKFTIFYLIFGLLCVLIFLHHGIMLELRRFSYLYQRFQRRKYVPVKLDFFFTFISLRDDDLYLFFDGDITPIVFVAIVYY